MTVVCHVGMTVACHVVMRVVSYGGGSGVSSRDDSGVSFRDDSGVSCGCDSGVSYGDDSSVSYVGMTVVCVSEGTVTLTVPCVDRRAWTEKSRTRWLDFSCPGLMASACRSTRCATV